MLRREIPLAPELEESEVNRHAGLPTRSDIFPYASEARFRSQMAITLKELLQTRPVFAILSAIVFVIAVSLMHAGQKNLRKHHPFTFTKIPPAAQGGPGKSGCDLWTG